jgi:branched-chain amino acid transport system permease protein
MDYAAIVVLEILYMIAFLALISAGLAIVFGMMRVINLAHGEFVMLGGYATSTSPCWSFPRSSSG